MFGRLLSSGPPHRCHHSLFSAKCGKTWPASLPVSPCLGIRVYPLGLSAKSTASWHHRDLISTPHKHKHVLYIHAVPQVRNEPVCILNWAIWVLQLREGGAPIPHSSLVAAPFMNACTSTYKDTDRLTHRHTESCMQSATPSPAYQCLGTQAPVVHVHTSLSQAGLSPELFWARPRASKFRDSQLPAHPSCCVTGPGLLTPTPTPG